MPTAKKATLEDLWSIVAELGKAQKETDRQLKETSYELKASHERLSESIDKANGNFNQKWGDFLENFIEGDLLNIFKNRDIEVNRVLHQAQVKRSDNTVEAEYDFVLINGNEIIVIEVKTTVSSSKLNTFLNKLKNFKKYFPEYRDKNVYGGVAYINASRELIENAEENRLFLIQAPGGENNVTKITNSQGFVPKTY